MLLGLLMAGPLAAQQGSEGPGDLLLGTVRLYRGDGTTRVKAFVEIPYRLFSRGPDGRVRYAVVVAVKDSLGQALMQERWSQSATPVESVRSAAGLEILEFEVAPGRYQLGVQVTDSLTGEVHRDSARFEGFATAPAVSDLILSRSVRAATPQDSLPRGGEWRHGNLVISGTTLLRLPISKPELYYLIEAYSPKADTAILTSQVLNDSGRVLVQIKPRTLQMEGGGAVLTGGVNLAGVPQGAYRLRMAVRFGEHESVREAPFQVRALETPPAEVAAGPDPDEVYFGAMTEAQLDSAQAPLIYIAKPGELSVYRKDLTAQAKARFLAQFWQKRDPALGDAVNPNRERFYERISEADHRFREAGRTRVQGWRVDRGRIFLKYGEPDEVFTRPEEGITGALEVWRYSRGKSRFFIFADRSRIGTFLLQYSNEVTEPGRPDWQEQLGFHGVEAVERFLGISLGLRGSDPP